MKRVAAQAKSHPLRWYQFAIGTWLLVVLIVGWALTCRPYWVMVVDSPAAVERGSSKSVPDPALFYAHDELNPRLIWPALALVAIATWKAARFVQQWNAYRRTQPAENALIEAYTPKRRLGFSAHAWSLLATIVAIFIGGLIDRRGRPEPLVELDCFEFDTTKSGSGNQIEIPMPVPPPPEAKPGNVESNLPNT